MKILIHDLDNSVAEGLLKDNKEFDLVISDDGTIKACIGCFACWIKNPGLCILKDSYSDTGANLSKCDDLIIISRSYYGGYSPFVKNVLDRGISYVHPYFVIRNGQMHHKRRYKNRIGLQVGFYGSDITEEEKATAEKLVRANSINYDGYVKDISFAKDPTEIFNSFKIAKNV